MFRFTVMSAAVLLLAAVAWSDNDKTIFDDPEKKDAAKSDAKPADKSPAPPATPEQETMLSKIPEIKRIEQAHERQTADADSTRIAEYRKYFEKIRKSGDIEKAAAVQARLQQLEDESDPKKSGGAKLRVLSATYGAGDGIVDITDAFRRKLGGKSSCRFLVNNANLGVDPFPGSRGPHTLIVRYSINGGATKIKYEHSGREFALP